MTDLTGGLDASEDLVFPVRPDDPATRDHASFWVFDDGGTVGVPRLAIEALAGDWGAPDLQVNIAFGGGRVCRLRGKGAKHPVEGPDGRPDVLGAGPLSFRCVEPFREWDVQFHGEAVETTIERLIAGDPDGASVAVDLAVRATMAVPPWVLGTLTTPPTTPLARPRFDQLFRAEGTLRVGDEEHPLRGSGLRNRAKAPLRLDGVWGHVWMGALFPSGRAFGCIAYGPSTSGPNPHDEAFVFTGTGGLVAARIVAAPWITGLVAEGEPLRLVLESDLGPAVIDGTTRLSTFDVAPRPDVADFPGLHQGGVRYRWDGEETDGMIERSFPVAGA